MPIRSLSFDAKKDPEFIASKSTEAEFYRALKKVGLNSGHIVEAHADGASLKDQKAMMKALEDYSELLTPWARRQAEKMMDQVLKANKRKYNQQSKVIGKALNEGVGASNVGHTALALLEEQVALIKSIPLEAGRRAQEIAAKNFLNGARAMPDQSVVDQLVNEMGMSTEVAVNRAKLIARTETARANAAFVQARAAAIGVTHYVWRTSEDSAVRSSHKHMNGKVIAYDNPPHLDDGTTGHAGTFPNCLPGSAKLNGTPSIEIAYRHIYDGPLVTMKLSNGRALSATPNHPVMTRSGMKAIQDIDLGEDVLCEHYDSARFIDNDIQRFDVSFEQLFSALEGLPISICSACIGGKFHGDITNEEVNIVSVDSRLVLEAGTAIKERMLKLGLSYADVLFVDRCLLGNCSFADIEIGPSETSNSIMRCLNLILPLLRSHLTPFDLFCLALRSELTTGLNQVAPDDLSADTKRLSNQVLAYTTLVHGFDFIEWKVNHPSFATGAFANRSSYPTSPKALANQVGIDSNNFGDVDQGLAGQYEFSCAIEKSVSEFQGHVYNLQTASGFYVANGVFKENCRCWQDPVLPYLDK